MVERVIRKAKFSAWAGVLVVVMVLNSCLFQNDLAGASPYGIVATTDKAESALSTPIEITLQDAFLASEGSPNPEEVVFDLQVGACFILLDDPAIKGGFCEDGDRPLPPELRLIEGNYANLIGDFIIRRGSEKPYIHTFSITSNEIVRLRVVPYYALNLRNDDPSSRFLESGISTDITFK